MSKEILFMCMECKKKFYTLDAAEKAAWTGCPKCNSGDIEPYYKGIK